MQERVRISLPYENQSQRFRVTAKDRENKWFRRQYYYVYKARVDALKERIADKGRELLGPDIPMQTLSDVKTEDDYFVLGVILKKLKNRPSVLTEFVEAAGDDAVDIGIGAVEAETYASDEDTIELEDDEQIVKLIGKIDKNKVTSGMIVGIYGHQIKGGDFFEVKEMVLPTLAPQVEWPIFEEDSYVLFVSGISLTSGSVQNEDTLRSLSLLYEWITAQLVTSEEDLKIVESISRVVIAGESITVANVEFDKLKVTSLGVLQDLDSDAIGQFDKFLSRLVSNVPVDLMPGPNDPVGDFWPQQRFPRSIFPLAERFGDMMNVVTNPYAFELGGLRFVGTSGHNIQDLSRLTIGFTEIELMEQCLRYSHIAPTIPDTLDGFPFKDRDPLLLDELPHVFFAGNHQALEQSIVELEDGQRTKLFTIPSFSETKTAVLLNLKTMEAVEKTF